MPKTMDIEDLLYWAFRDEKVESRDKAHQDALTLYWAVTALPDPFCHLIQHHARIGHPPDWHSVTEGRVIHLVAVRYWRDRYDQWHRALGVLRHTVNGALKDHAATGPAAPARPWHDGRVAANGRQKRAL
ncbi:MAG TPA: hypothetical protein VIN06_07470 [Devosia sp.]